MSIELNNPGNIRVSDTPWRGKVAPSKNPSFETFETPYYGIRAMMRVLLTYFHRGLDTIEDIISEWAPSSENDTDTYIDNVSDATGFDSDVILKPDADTLCKLAQAITHQENGKNPYEAALFATAATDVLSPKV